MTDARTNILARLQQDQRESTTPQPIPTPSVKASSTSTTTLLEQFKRGLDKVSASHEVVTTEALIAEAIERYLHQQEAGNQLVVAPAINHAGLLRNCTLQLQPAPTRGNEKNAITLAYAGIAETGSLVMLSAADTPVTTNFLPDNFICVLKTTDVLKDMEALWARMLSEQRSMPRCVNLITGPSRTADVEQVIQIGAHGPRRVHVILWEKTD
ncbi:MAG: LutC/YkgG family protein [Gammaproteobacteria bacterium]